MQSQVKSKAIVILIQIPQKDKADEQNTHFSYLSSYYLSKVKEKRLLFRIMEVSFVLVIFFPITTSQHTTYKKTLTLLV